MVLSRQPNLVTASGGAIRPFRNAVETKHFTTNYGHTQVRDGNVVTSLWTIFSPSAGTTVEGYTGTRVIVKGLYIHGLLAMNYTSAAYPTLDGTVQSSSTIGMAGARAQIVFYQSDKIYITLLSLLTEMFDTTGGLSYLDSPVAVGFPGRILARQDLLASSSTAGNTAGNTRAKTINKFMKCTASIRYDDSGINQESGQVGFFIIDNNTSANPMTTFTGASRFMFQDGFGYNSLRVSNITGAIGNGSSWTRYG